VPWFGIQPAKVSAGLTGRAQKVLLPACLVVSQQFAENGGELFVCPICFHARKLDESKIVLEYEARWRDTALGVGRRGRQREA
jgi:hypothetical protein